MKNSTVSISGGLCFRGTCGSKAVERRTFGVGMSNYAGSLCLKDKRDFDQVWQVWRRLSQAADCEQIRHKCAMCPRLGSTLRWFQLAGARRVVNLCETHMHNFDHDVAVWAVILADVAMDDVLTEGGQEFHEVARETQIAGQGGRDATARIRGVMVRQLVEHRKTAPEKIFVPTPRGSGWDLSGVHFTREAYDRVKARGLAPILVAFAAVYPETTGTHYEANEMSIVHSRGDGDEAVHVVLDLAGEEIRDAYGSIAWARRTPSTNNRKVPA